MIESLKNLIISYVALPVARESHWSLERYKKELQSQLNELELTYEHNGGW